MSLSVCCPTADPGPRVHAILEPLRAVADEIVVAADSRTSASDLAWYAAVSDRLFSFEYTNVERAYAWLHAQCTSEWVLLLEGDECASPELIARLPELTRQREVEQVYIPRRWLYPDAEHWLDESPWWPDLANRLVRNSGALFFPGLLHTDPVRADPVMFIESPIYHLDTLRPFEDRRAKVSFYDTTTSHLRAGGVRDVNATYYLPERASRRRPAEVPPEDRAAVQLALAGTPGPAPPARSRVQAAPLAETDRHFAGRPFTLTAQDVRLEPAERDLAFRPGEQRGLLFRLTNTGLEIWPWGLDRSPYVHLAYERRDSSTGEWRAQPEISPLPQTVPPGATALLPVTVTAPTLPGAYDLRVDLCHAGHGRSGNGAVVRIEVLGGD